MDYLEIRELYHADIMEKEKARIISEFEIFNTDFLDDLPYQVRNVLDSLKWRFRTEDWFPEAWEKYRQHVLEAGLGGEIKMPGYIFNPYLERYVDEHFRESNNNLGECRYSDMEIGEYLAHHGIKGQRWGIRRFQNEDGSLTAEGKKRYGYDESTGKMSKAGKRNFKADIKSERSKIIDDYDTDTEAYVRNKVNEIQKMFGTGNVEMTTKQFYKLYADGEKYARDKAIKKYGNRSVQELEDHERKIKTGFNITAAVLGTIGGTAAAVYVYKHR